RLPRRWVAGRLANAEVVFLRGEREPPDHGLLHVIDDLSTRQFSEGLTFFDEFGARKRFRSEESPPRRLGLASMPVEKIGEQGSCAVLAVAFLNISRDSEKKLAAQTRDFRIFRSMCRVLDYRARH